MDPSGEQEDVLQAAVAGVRKVAAAIAALPREDRERAFEAAERAYAQTVRDLDYPEDAARSWVSAMMHRLRADVQEVAEAGTDHSPGDATP
jgi:hypothetical protein